ncbi:hypothetical protein EVAR_102610_1 [Eumeta japonica]|uniref:Uncharacterized protein n=1 Tax=Eumeta variegata TaxID=151549 RepID=A0A4C1TUQ4_EUMVA|nr:hypothetical protein EVAR_102610_1 [Eumeta japonica]
MLPGFPRRRTIRTRGLAGRRRRDVRGEGAGVTAPRASGVACAGRGAHFCSGIPLHAFASPPRRTWRRAMRLQRVLHTRWIFDCFPSATSKVANVRRYAGKGRRSRDGAAITAVRYPITLKFSGQKERASHSRLPECRRSAKSHRLLTFRTAGPR